MIDGKPNQIINSDLKVLGDETITELGPQIMLTVIGQYLVYPPTAVTFIKKSNYFVYPFPL